jgi:PhnB protein
MAKVAPYLNFNGNAGEAFNFYKSVFGGEFSTVMRFKDVRREYSGSESEAEKIMHVSLPLAHGSFLMGGDVPDAFGKAIVGTNSYVSVHTESEDEANKIFDGLSVGGQLLMPLGKTFWGSYFGMFKDKFGIQWMVSYEYNRA